ncbi:MAG: methanol dehydrogenase [Cyanobacteria bacterium SW_9_44_58]|nr:MAG: methanol dehydrogenase [Cyanobacteria bacterium SW_9_44_58]
MSIPSWQRLLVLFISCCFGLTAWLTHPHQAQAYDDPSLLPEQQTPIIDLANFLPKLQEESLTEKIKQFEGETGWKLRILTQYDRTPGRAVKEYWDLNDKSVLLIADARGGNLLAFNVGDDVYDLLPRTFWVELQTRFGNMYYVRENGENNAIAASLDTVKGCLAEGGCDVVPGLPQDQWILTLITSVVGGLVFGFAAKPRTEDQIVAWQWALMFSPLWGILFIAFGIGPVVTRTADWLPLLRNILGFASAALIAYLLPILNQSRPSEGKT